MEFVEIFALLLMILYAALMLFGAALLMYVILCALHSYLCLRDKTILNKRRGQALRTEDTQ